MGKYFPIVIAKGRKTEMSYARKVARYHEMKARGVKFHGEPRQESYDKVVVFEDLYGNKWDLVESTP